MPPVFVAVHVGAGMCPNLNSVAMYQHFAYRPTLSQQRKTLQSSVCKVIKKSTRNGKKYAHARILAFSFPARLNLFSLRIDRACKQAMAILKAAGGSAAEAVVHAVTILEVWVKEDTYLTWLYQLYCFRTTLQQMQATVQIWRWRAQSSATLAIWTILATGPLVPSAEYGIQ